MEIPLYILITIPIASFSLGFAMGRFLKPTTSQAKDECIGEAPNKEYVHKINLRMTNQKAVFTNCPQYNHLNKKCRYSDKKCKFIS